MRFWVSVFQWKTKHRKKIKSTGLALYWQYLKGPSISSDIDYLLKLGIIRCKRWKFGRASGNNQFGIIRCQKRVYQEFYILALLVLNHTALSEGNHFSSQADSYKRECGFKKVCRNALTFKLYSHLSPEVKGSDRSESLPPSRFLSQTGTLANGILPSKNRNYSNLPVFHAINHTFI